MKPKIDLRQSFLACLPALVAGIAFAHHSVAMWDNSKTLAFVGTVKAFQWTTPHCFVHLLVPQSASVNDALREWSIETASPSRIKKFGCKSGTLKPGDHIQVSVHPSRDGTPTGSLITALTVDGQPVVSVRQVHRP